MTCSPNGSRLTGPGRAAACQAPGPASEADDAVQEAWLRLSRTDPGNIKNLGGRLTTAVARVCPNMLQAPGDGRLARAASPQCRIEMLRPASLSAAGRSLDNDLRRPAGPSRPVQRSRIER